MVLRGTKTMNNEQARLKHGKSLALQSILFFILAYNDGKTRLEAITEYTKSEICLLFGPNLTVGAVYEMAERAGYHDLETSQKRKSN